MPVQRQTIQGTPIKTDELGTEGQKEQPMGNFLTSSAKRLILWTCVNGHKIIMKEACKCR